MLSDEATSMARSTMNMAVPSSPEGRRSALAPNLMAMLLLLLVTFMSG